MGLDINETSIKKEGLNLAIDLEEIVQSGLVQNLKFGEINSKINMLRIDKEEMKKNIEIKLSNLKSNMIKQFSEMEKLEKLNNNNKNMNKLNFNINSDIKGKEHIINNNRENGITHDCIRLNYKFDIVKIEKPIVFKTPSGKVVLLANQKKAVEIRKDKEIKGKKLEAKNK